jgi:hypothetical protein
MTTLEKIPPRRGTGCPPPPGRGRLAARALAWTVLVLLVTCGEVVLIKKAVSSGPTGASGARDGIVRIVDDSLASGLAPIVILP